jgi:multiple sugar transport system permease protein
VLTAGGRIGPALPYLLVAPALVVLAAAVLYPIGFNLFAALHRWNLLESDTPQAFRGLATIAEVLSDGRFWHALRVTLLLTTLAVAIEFVAGLALALMVNEAIWGRQLIRTLLVAPIMATPLVVALVFRLMWHGEFGVINHYLGYLGIGPVVWLSGPWTAFAAILVTEVWHNTSFVFLVLLGALQMLPREPYEAALLDGATWLQRLRHVTLPLLKPAILVALLFRVVFAIRLFDEVWVLTRGGPNGATETISILLFKAAFEVFDVAEAAALSMVLLLLTAALAFVIIRTLYGRESV